MRKFWKYLIFIIVFLVSAVVGLAFFNLKDKIAPVSLPPAETHSAATNLAANANNNSQTQSVDPAPPANLPAQVNLAVSFTSQAPHQNWDLPYQQFCEEASVLMAASYVKNQPISVPNDADAKLLAIRNFEIKRFGFYEDTNADETAIILREYFDISKVEVVPNPTSDTIKSDLAQGKVVIVPLAGREIGNPNYKQPGPLYHMLVIKGYTKNGDFITNDPGTRKGADYTYKPSVIINATHDWNSGDVYNGKKVMIVVG